MDLSRLIEQLRTEVANLDAAILSLERLQSREKRQGRPPKAITEARTATANPKAKPSQPRRTRSR